MSTKKTFVTLFCAGALFSIVNAPLIHADEPVKPDAVETVKPAEPAVPKADAVETANKPETPAVTEAPKADTNKTSETPVIPDVPTTDTSKTSEAPAVTEAPTTATTDTSKTEAPAVTEVPTTKPSTEDTKPVEDKKDNTNLPIVNPTAPDTKPIETNKGTVTGTDNGKVIVKDTSTGEERKVAPEELGGKVEKDGTVTVKEKDGKLTRLPNTGVEESIPMVVAGITMLTSGFGLLKRPRKKD